MSVNAGSILHVAGNNVIDRVQSAGLGDVRVPVEVVREVGNREVIDKVPGDPDFTFNLETWDVSTEVEAWLAGNVGVDPLDPADVPGATDPAGTRYDFLDMVRAVSVVSPWKDPTSGAAGDVEMGHIIPGYFLNRIRYRFGVTDNATEEFELGGGSFYYGPGAPVEQFEDADGIATAFATDDAAIPHRIGGAGGTTFKSVFGVAVDGVLQVEGVDYTQAPSNSAAPAIATVTFTDPPADGAQVQFVYFSSVARAFPQAVHASAINKPGSVRGRHICVFLGSGGSRVKLGGVQGFELEATIDGAVEREFCNEEIVGRTVNGTDTTGSVTVRSKNGAAFLALLSKVTGVSADEVIGFLNTNDIPLEVQILNPRNPGQVLKTLFVEDAIFQVPGTPARVNTPTDFALRWESRRGSYEAVKGALV